MPHLESCPFCAYLSGRAECAFVTRTDTVASFVNLRQYERGALLVIPVAHVETLLDLEAQDLSSIYAEAARVGRALVRAFDATGLNVFQNNGVDAGQTVPHYHVHVVPRYGTSDPRRQFHEASFEPVSFATREEIAAVVRAALD